MARSDGVLLCATERASPAAAHPGRPAGTPPDRQNGTSLSTLTASIDLAPTAPSITAARHVVLELLRVWGTPQDRDDAALLVTELVANVVDHVGGEASLTLELTSSEGWLRIAVRDGSSVRPVVQELSQERPRGRGLRMVRAIADRWGSEDHQGGKRVWFELGPAQDT